ILGMVWNLAASPYWQEHPLFGATIIFGLIANTVNASILLARIADANGLLAEKIEEVSRLAWQDQLTKLPNRPYFRERLAQMGAAIGEIEMFAEPGLRIGASVGIACSGPPPFRERIANELLIQADRAMYEAKRAGKGRYKFAGDSG